ncbi:MAG: T9SS type A sorting domain-containing protein, partial [Ignavibacteria bacterium]|nr:T9SS type A sorting domain-containing protein [Ignavibacteria bacterium]
ICGRARINVPSGETPIEGGIADPNPGKGWYGGTDDDDSSGVLRYVRIEFAGIAVLPNNELNGLTLGGVGRRTVLDYIQVSYANDDAFEWFGGTVNAKHLIAFGTLDDDFDCDFGFSGKVQFGLVKRFRQIADVSTSQAFECDNDGSSSFNKPLTSATFSNITAIGPIRDTSWTTGTGNNQYSSRFGAGAQIRRNARVSIFNSIFMGWPRGIEIAQTATMFAALTDSLAVRASNWFGVKGTWLNLAGGTAPPGMDATWIETPTFSNGLDASNPNNAQLTNPWPENGAFDPIPYPTAPYLNTALYNNGGPLYPISDAFFTKVEYRGAFSADGQVRWDAGWANYDPVNTEYKASVNVIIRSPGAGTGEKYVRGTKVNVTWDTTGTRNETFKIEYGTTITGPWTTVAASVTDAGANRGIYEWTLPNIVMSSVYVRLSAVSDQTSFDVSDFPFAITDVPQPVVRVIAPGAAAGESYRVGQTIAVRWDTTNTLSQRWKIEFGKSATGPWRMILANVKDSASARGSALVVFRREDETTTGYVRLILLSDTSRTDVNDNPFTVSAPAPVQCDSVLKGEITGRVHLSGTKVYCLDGYVFVNDGGVLEIEPGTIVLGDTVGQNSVLAINRGGKILARGTPQKPIIFSSSARPGERSRGDWGGVVICGRARINVPSGETPIEGGIADPNPGKGWYGGTDDDDSSGFRGKSQFGLGKRFRSVADVSTSQTFEQDNDGSGSANEPFTAPVFSNITSIGPIQDTSWTTGNGNNQYNSRYGAAAQIRRNARTSIHNSVFIGWPRGIEIAQSVTMEAAYTNEFEVRNDSWYGIKGSWMNLASGTPPAGMDENWIAQTSFNNIIDKSSPNVAMLENSFATDADFNPVPKAGSPLLAASTEFTGTASDPFFENVSYRGAFGMQRWDLPWANYDPVNAEYKPQDTTTSVDDAVPGAGHVVSGSAQPNPAQDVALIRYELSSTDNITIRVFDVTGSIASTFIANVEQGVGVYEFKLITSSLGNGIYYVAITGRKGSFTIPVTVTR